MMNNIQIRASLLGVTAVIAIVQPAHAKLAPEQIADIAKKITVRMDVPGTVGSGVIIRQDGDIYTILTAYHVVKNTAPQEEAYVTTFDNQKHRLDTRSIRRLGNWDLATIQFRSNNNYQIAKIADSNKLREGMNVYVSGFPKPTETIDEAVFNFLDGSLIAILPKPNPDGYQIVYNNKTWTGVSGGSILNDNGELVGIHGLAEGETVRGSANPVKSGRNLGIPSALFVGLLDNLAASPHEISPITPTVVVPKASADMSVRSYLAMSVRSYLARGIDKQNKSDFRGAIADYTQAIQINPQYALAYYSRGEAKYALGDKQGAIADYNQVIQIDPNFAAVVYMGRGNAKSDLGDNQGAIADYTQAIQMYPKYADAYYNRGLAYKVLGNRQEALESFRQAARLYQQQRKPSDYQDAQNQIKKLGE